MIYATIDVDLRDHEKAVEAGLEAMGLWTWGMLYARSQKRNGELPRAVVLRSPWGTPEAIERAAARLVEVGLWVVVDGGWQIGNYARKNQTKEAIERSMADAAERKARSRTARSHVTAEPLSRVTPPEGGRVTPGSGSGYGSRSGSGDGYDSETGEVQEGDGDPVVPPDLHPRPVVLGADPSRDVPGPIGLDDQPTEDERGIAEQVGLTDPRLPWRKFLAHYAAQGVRWTIRERIAKWQKWAADEVLRRRTRYGPDRRAS